MGARGDSALRRPRSRGRTSWGVSRSHMSWSCPTRARPRSSSPRGSRGTLGRVQAGISQSHRVHNCRGLLGAGWCIGDRQPRRCRGHRLRRGRLRQCWRRGLLRRRHQRRRLPRCPHRGDRHRSGRERERVGGEPCRDACRGACGWGGTGRPGGASASGGRCRGVVGVVLRYRSPS